LPCLSITGKARVKLKARWAKVKGKAKVQILGGKWAKGRGAKAKYKKGKTERRQR
jgi:hypothetical protein